MSDRKLLHADVTERVLQSFFHVYNTLGHGFLEKVYENALAVSLRKHGRHVVQQMPVRVYFEDEIVGEYIADLVVDDVVILELKCAHKIIPVHEAQLMNYLKATEYEVGMLLNFGPKPDFRRRVLQNAD